VAVAAVDPVIRHCKLAWAMTPHDISIYSEQLYNSPNLHEMSSSLTTILKHFINPQLNKNLLSIHNGDR